MDDDTKPARPPRPFKDEHLPRDATVETVAPLDDYQPPSVPPPSADTYATTGSL